MKVTLTSIIPSPGAQGTPCLTPEMLAAVGARYSRNGEGLETILSAVAGMDPDQAVDSIFRMVDYGHASIADMTPVPIFIDGVSLWLAWKLWSLMPRATGQETSTRYVQYDGAGVLDAAETGLPQHLHTTYTKNVRSAFRHYKRALETWMEVATERPELVRLPAGAGPKATARIRRNFAFDRARYWLPASAKTNLCLFMNALDWSRTIRWLLSTPLPETQALGKALAGALAQAAPRMVRHATASPDAVAGAQEEVADLAAMAGRSPALSMEASPEIEIQLTAPLRSWDMHPERGPEASLDHHPHRYSWVGPKLSRWHATFRVHGVAFAEIRDLNRHRTGHKWQPRVPLGFYGAQDQTDEAGVTSLLSSGIGFGLSQSSIEHEAVLAGQASAPYLGLLGTTYLFEHGTSLNHLIYEIELRTGTGSHWRYADLYRGVHSALVREMPELDGLIHLGSAEPE